MPSRDAPIGRLVPCERLPCANLAPSGASRDAPSSRPCVLQAVARSEPRIPRAANGQLHARACRSPRRPLAARFLLVDERYPRLHDDVRRRASARPVVGARCGHCPGHPCERALLHPSGACSIASSTRPPKRSGTRSKRARRSRDSSRRAEHEQPSLGRSSQMVPWARSVGCGRANPRGTFQFRFICIWCIFF